MNCAHSARSFPSGGRSANRTATVKMGANVSRPRRSCPEMRSPHNVMSADTFGNCLSIGCGGCSRQNLSHDARRFHAGQLLFETLKRIVQLPMVEAQQVKHRRMQVADLDRIFYDFTSHLIGLAVGNSGLDPAAGHPNRERSWVMVPADPLHFLTVAILAHGRPAEFSAPDNERVLEHASLFQISQQGRSRLIHFTSAVG